MRITAKGQVTIPAEIRERAGLLPHTEVEFTGCNGDYNNKKSRAARYDRAALDFSGSRCG